MEITKPDYPKVLLAYNDYKGGSGLCERKIIYNKTQEESFKLFHSAKKHRIDEESPKHEDIKHLSFIKRTIALTPKWVFYILSALAGFLLAKLT